MKILIADTETTKDQTVADFGAVVADLSTGEILDEIGVLIYGEFDEKELWFDPRAKADDFWSKQNARARRKKYRRRIEQGSRSIASPALVNIWLAKNFGKHNPTATAYNLAFDGPKCDRTGIQLGMFSRSVCLMKIAKRFLVDHAPFLEHCQRHNAFTPTGRPRMTADNVARFILGDALDPEPHTALEDARDYELPIAQFLFDRGLL